MAWHGIASHGMAVGIMTMAPWRRCFARNPYLHEEHLALLRHELRHVLLVAPPVRRDGGGGGGDERARSTAAAAAAARRHRVIRCCAFASFALRTTAAHHLLVRELDLRPVAPLLPDLERGEPRALRLLALPLLVAHAEHFLVGRQREGVALVQQLRVRRRRLRRRDASRLGCHGGKVEKGGGGVGCAVGVGVATSCSNDLSGSRTLVSGGEGK